jgi:predicted DNA-binding antitoxin AbrB/MazE fold protein
MASATAIKAVYEDGVFKPTEPVTLEEHTPVEVRVVAEAAANEDDPTGWKAADELIGFIKGGLKEPVGEEHDQHLYRR